MGSLIDSFIAEFKEYRAKLNAIDKEAPVVIEKEFSKEELLKLEEDLIKLIDSAKDTLLDDSQKPSIYLKDEINKLHIRSKEPMKVAITGQFSSGKSTFLNALLSKSILPTGITPVTSKVNYIRYGEETKLQIRYKDGREEYHSVENIKRFTDQRERVEEIDFLTLFSPLELLKDIIFVDTPGLNSQSDSDTETTSRVLKEVDGIIWLTLIDNAGKRSEEKTLESFLDAYQSKSLCVLNQKDKFDSVDEINESLNYVKTKFEKYFSEVVAISAKQALEARSKNEASLIDDEVRDFIKNIKEHLKANPKNNIKEQILNNYTCYLDNLKSIESLDLSENSSLLKDSNIEQVLSFIQNEIQPRAIESKNYAVRQDLREICETLAKQNSTFIGVFDNFIDILNDFGDYFQGNIAKYRSEFDRELRRAFAKIENMIDKIASEIYKNIKEEKRVRFFEGKKSMLGKIPILSEEYSFYKIDIDRIRNNLFDDKKEAEKIYKDYRLFLNEIRDSLNLKFSDLFEYIKDKIALQQGIYENFEKVNVINSDIKCDDIRVFASKSYENILKNYNDEILLSIGKVEAEFRHLKIIVKGNYKNATFKTIQMLETERERARVSYEKNPIQFPFYQPTIKEITHNLEQGFEIDELKKIMIGNQSFLTKRFEAINEIFSKTKDETILSLEKSKQIYEQNLNDINQFKTQI